MSTNPTNPHASAPILTSGLPLAEAKAAMILVHGRGASARDILSLTQLWRADGIAYLAPEPGATPFITVGRTVAAGQTVLLIEAMKTFNQIKAPHAGTVTRILITSGEPVEYAQPLLVIE